MDEGGGEEKEKEGGESVIGFQEHPVNFHHLDLLRKKVLGPVEVETDVRPALQRVIFNVVNFSKTKSLYRDGMSPVVKSTSRPKCTVPSKRHHVSCTYGAIFNCLGFPTPQLTLFVSPQSGQDAFNTTSSI
ncbi:hypothetical protein JOQ06_005991 [Pogonophryne albipinna]|uniref:Uncharacterized protein n=1 Tax=Pogonophryne albipinna TaxID=1090488 RepID=A0AAD6BJW6_9TELE|nr:hypothetical protein JOQ06_005991 [Pogonophryne albipinna]